MASHSGAGLATVYSAVFLDSMGTSMILPLLPFLAIQMGATAFDIGCLQSFYSLGQIVGSFVFGYLSDIIGRRSVLLACLLFSSLSLIGLGCARDIMELLALRTLNGFFAGTLGICQAIAADMSHELTSSMGKIGAATGLGLVLGPGIGGLINQYGFLSACLLGAALNFLNFVAGLWMIPVGSQSTKGEAAGRYDGATEETRLGRKCLDVFMEPQIVWLFIMCFFQQVAFGVPMGIGAIYVHTLYGMSGTTLGLLYCSGGVSMALAQTFLTKPAAAKYGEKICIMTGNLLRAFFFAILVIVIEPWVPYIALIGMIASGSIIAPCMASAVNHLSPENMRGSVLGSFQAMGCLGNFVGPLAGSAVFDGHITMPFWGCVFLSLLTTAITPMAFRKKYHFPDSPMTMKKTMRRPSQLELIHTDNLALPNIFMNPEFCREFSIEPKLEFSRSLSVPLADNRAQESLKRFSI